MDFYLVRWIVDKSIFGVWVTSCSASWAVGHGACSPVGGDASVGDGSVDLRVRVMHDRVDNLVGGNTCVGCERGDRPALVDCSPQDVGCDADRGRGHVEFHTGESPQHLLSPRGLLFPPRVGDDDPIRRCIETSSTIRTTPMATSKPPMSV